MVLGWVDDIDTCECGKTGLNRVCAVEHDNGEVVYYGSVCIGRHLGTKAGKAAKSRADIISQINKVKDEDVASYVLTKFGWEVKNGWVIDGFGQKVYPV